MRYLLFTTLAALLLFNALAADKSSSSTGSWQIDGIFPPTG